MLTGDLNLLWYLFLERCKFMDFRKFDYTLKSAFPAKHVGAKIVFARPGVGLWDTVMLKQ